MKNPNQPKGKGGKFVKRSDQIKIDNTVTDHEYIVQVKNEIMILHADIDRIRKAYSIITKQDDYFPNIAMMKKMILSHSGN